MTINYLESITIVMPLQNGKRAMYRTNREPVSKTIYSNNRTWCITNDFKQRAISHRLHSFGSVLLIIIPTSWNYIPGKARWREEARSIRLMSSTQNDESRDIFVSAERIGGLIIDEILSLEFPISDYSPVQISRNIRRGMQRPQPNSALG